MTWWQEVRREGLTARSSAPLLVLPLLLSALLLSGGSEHLLFGTALAVAGTFLTSLVAVRGLVAELLAAVTPSPPVPRVEPSNALPQNEPAAAGNPQPRAPGTSPLPC